MPEKITLGVVVPILDSVGCQSCAFPTGVAKLVPGVQWEFPHNGWFIVIDTGVVATYISTAAWV